MDADPLARIAAIERHAMQEHLRRDERFRHLRPSGLWALSEWTGFTAQANYATALEAGVAVLSELGPLPLKQYAQHLISRYPVSLAQVQNTLLSVELGRWPDGRLDLSASGAPVVEEREPQMPPHVVVDSHRALLRFRHTVDREVLRGSGVAVHPFITWYLGLRNAPATRRFVTEDGTEVFVRRHIGSAAISSLRAFALSLGAREGEALEITLDVQRDEAEIVLSSDQ